MRRLVIVALMIASGIACVNLDKPASVQDCAKRGTCNNGKGDASGIAGPDAAPTDATPADNPDGDSDDAAGDSPATGGEDAGYNGPAGSEVGAGVASGACSGGGAPKPAGTICRPAVGLCDLAEVCDGISLDCPADKLAPVATPCRVAAGDCDIAETCDGKSAACPADGFKTAGTVCRPAAGVCDVAESCDGTRAACPADSVSPTGTVCRASTDKEQCDPSETCTGTGVTCPPDLHYVRPAAPTGVKATPGTLSATVSWAVTANATGYNVKQSTTSGAGYTTLVSSPTAVAPPFTSSGLVGGATYYYVVSAIDTIPGCESASSLEVSATPTGSCVAPAAPVITASAGNGSIMVTWAAVPGAVSYVVARSASSGTGYITVANVTTGTTFTDSNVANGVTGYYVVTASNGTCTSGKSNEASATPACVPPAAPADLTATASNGSVTLKWSATATAVSYSIYRSTTGAAPFTFINSTTQLTFTDSNVANGSKYAYVVRASNGTCASDNSAIVSATPACTPPPAPTGLAVTAGDKALTLSWTASPGATQYRVSRDTGGSGSFVPVGTPTTTSYADGGLVNGTTYAYVVAASNGSCWSVDSAAAQGTPLCVPPAVPGTLVATPGDARVSLAWGASPGASVYTIWRKTGAAGTYAPLATASATSYLDTSVTNGVTYYYKITAGNGSCASAADAEQAAAPTPACTQSAPVSVKATASGSVQVTLTWQAATPAPTSYTIARSTTSGTGYASIGSVAGSLLTYTDVDTALVKNTAYYYQVTANGVCSTSAAEVSATTACANPSTPALPTVTSASGAVTVNWAAVASATAYTVYRSTSAAGGYSAVSTNQTAATYTDPASALGNGNTYYYALSASNANGQCSSDPSSGVAVTPCQPLDPPTGLSRSVGTSGTVVINWTAVANATRYSVLRGTASGGPFTAVGSSATTSFTDTGLTNDSSYYYAVATIAGSAGTCASANSASLLAIPRACQVLASDATSFTLATTAGDCFVTCNDIKWGWNCSSFDTTNRSLSVNGQAVACGASLPAQANSAFTFKIGATNTNHTWDSIWWAGNVHACP